MRNKCSGPVRNRRYIEKEPGTVSPPIFPAPDAHNRLYKTHMGCSLRVEVLQTSEAKLWMNDFSHMGTYKDNSYSIYSERISYFNEGGFCQ